MQEPADLSRLGFALTGSLGVVIPSAPRKQAKRAPKEAAPAPLAQPAPAPKLKATYSAMASAGSGPSKAAKPTEVTWSICERMRGSRRRDVIAAAVEAGISYNTARTQYQLWLTTTRVRERAGK